MSTDYYTRLEQQRGPQPSEQMLTALARALRMTVDEHDYLFEVAGRNPARAMLEHDFVAPALLRVLDRLDDSPALILSDICEVLVQNRMAAALFGDGSARTGWARSEIYRWFTDPGARAHYPTDDRDRQGRALVATLRAAYGSRGPTSRAAELVRLLQRSSPEFSALWDRHEVVRRFTDHKVLLHPDLGPIEVDCQALFTEDQSQALLVLTAPPHTEAHGKLELLAVLGNERMSAPR